MRAPRPLLAALAVAVAAGAGVVALTAGGTAAPPGRATPSPSVQRPAEPPADEVPRDARAVELPAALPRLRLVARARAFAGYPLLVGVRAGAVPDGTPVVVEHAAADGRWRSVGADAVIAQRARVLVRRLPAGRARLRVRVRAGTFAALSAPRTVRVRPARRWSTVALAGRYRGPRGVAFRVARGGREVRGLTARVRSVCNGVSGTVLAARAALPAARLAPDGRFFGTGRVGASTRLDVSGRLTAAGLRRGRLEVTVGRCGGAATFRARRVA
jgi:hypothetical protein